MNLDAGRILCNEGVVTWKSNGVNLNASATGGAGRIDNAAGAVWDAQGNDSLGASTYADLNSLPGYAVFNNAGTFRKSGGGTGTTVVSAAFNNSGTVDVQIGRVSMQGAATGNGYSNAGTITTASDATFETNMIGKTFSNAGRIEGDGAIALYGSNNSLANACVISAGSGDTVGSLAIDLGSGGTFKQLSGGGGLTGAFDHIVALGFDPSWHFDLQYLNNSVVLHATTSAVPLPGAVWFMLTDMMGMLGAGRTMARKPAAMA